MFPAKVGERRSGLGRNPEVFVFLAWARRDALCWPYLARVERRSGPGASAPGPSFLRALLSRDHRSRRVVTAPAEARHSERCSPSCSLFTRWIGPVWAFYREI